MTLLMIVMICVGCGVALMGLLVVGFRAFALAKAVREAGIQSISQVQEVVHRAEKLPPRLEELQTKQKELAERLERLSTLLGTLTYLKKEISRAASFVTQLKS